MAQIEVKKGEPTPRQRLVHFGIFAAGATMAVVGWYYRDRVWGSLGLSAGSTVAGIGIAFFLMDLMGVRP